MHRAPNKRDARVPGKTYSMRETEKAVQLGLSASWLQKDRMKSEPEIDYARFGRTIRYAAD